MNGATSRGVGLLCTMISDYPRAAQRAGRRQDGFTRHAPDRDSRTPILFWKLLKPPQFLLCERNSPTSCAGHFQCNAQSARGVSSPGDVARPATRAACGSGLSRCVALFCSAGGHILAVPLCSVAHSRQPCPRRGSIYGIPVASRRCPLGPRASPTCITVWCATCSARCQASGVTIIKLVAP